MHSTESELTSSSTSQTVVSANSSANKKYASISNEQRQQLLKLIMKTDSIRKAARILGIQESSAKSIYYRYKKTGCLDRLPKVNKRYMTASLSRPFSENADCKTMQRELDNSTFEEKVADNQSRHEELLIDSSANSADKRVDGGKNCSIDADKTKASINDSLQCRIDIKSKATYLADQTPQTLSLIPVLNYKS